MASQSLLRHISVGVKNLNALAVEGVEYLREALPVIAGDARRACKHSHDIKNEIQAVQLQNDMLHELLVEFTAGSNEETIRTRRAELHAKLVELRARG